MRDTALNAVGWDSDPAVQWQRFPTLRGDVRVDACVVGLGGSGLAAVGDLLGRGMSVVGVDAGRIGGGAAGRNGGFLIAGSATPVHEFARVAGDDAAMEIYERTVEEIDHLETLLGGDVVRRVGSLRIAGEAGGMASQQASVAAQAEERDALRRESEDCEEQLEFLSSRNVPVSRYQGHLGSGLYFPRDAAINPVRRVMDLAQLYGGRAELYERSAALEIEPGAVRTREGSVTAEIVIVAVDGRLDVLLPVLADRVRTVRLQMLCTRPFASGTLPCPVYANWGYDYFQQDAMGRIFAGGGRDRFLESEWTVDAEPTGDIQSLIEDRLRRVLGGVPITVTHRWAASVGYTPDARPLVTSIGDGLVACGGYSGTGNLVGPIAARDAVALAVDGVIPPPYFAS